MERAQEPEDQEVCYNVASSRYDRKATPMKSQQYGCLNKTSEDHASQHVNMDGQHG